MRRASRPKRLVSDGKYGAREQRLVRRWRRRKPQTKAGRQPLIGQSDFSVIFHGRAGWYSYSEKMFTTTAWFCHGFAIKSQRKYRAEDERVWRKVFREHVSGSYRFLVGGFTAARILPVIKIWEETLPAYLPGGYKGAHQERKRGDPFAGNMEITGMVNFSAAEHTQPAGK